MGARRRLSFDKSVNEKVAGMGAAQLPETTVGQQQQQQSSHGLSVLATALILLAPLVIYQLLANNSDVMASWFSDDDSLVCGLPEDFQYWFLHPAVVFIWTAFGAIRYVVLQSLGQPVPSPQLPHEGPTTSRFSVDLKGVLRFVNLKRQDKREFKATQNARAEISLVHIVVTALARAMKKHSDCWDYQRVSLPLLGIDGYFRYPNHSVLDVSVASEDQVVTLTDFDHDNVQGVATDLLAQERNLQRQQRAGWMSFLVSSLSRLLPFGHTQVRHGRCLVLLTQAESEAENQRTSSSDIGGIDITPGRLPEGVDVMVVVGGIRLMRNTTPVTTGSPLRTPPPKALLSLSVTINTTSILDTAKCSALAEELQKLIEFPELCDDE
jgi:hypothetical protein